MGNKIFKIIFGGNILAYTLSICSYTRFINKNIDSLCMEYIH